MPTNNVPETPEQRAAREAWWAASLETNRLSILDYLHDPVTLADGTPAPFQDIMDEQAMTLANGAEGMAGVQQTALTAAWTWALNNDLPTSIEHADGTIASLVDIQDGVPLYNVGFNVEAAQTIGTYNVWPGGSSGLNLTGTNRTISMWDQGRPRLTHAEFASSRVTQMDGNVTNDNHSTAVAGTLAAGGFYDVYVGTPPNLTNIGKVAKGMSFGAKVQAWDYQLDTAEMLGSIGTNHMRLSNHSYGRSTGWTLDANNQWWWMGTSEISTNQDPKFGLYSATTSNLDWIVQGAPTYLSVWAAGNSVSNAPPVQPTNHFEYNLIGKKVTNNLVHLPDGYLGGYDTLSEQACAKNVVTVGAVYPNTNGYTGTNSVEWAWFSSCGPTDDGRIKPDVVAAGYDIDTTWGTGNGAYVIGIAGTSFSAPSVTGSLNLLAEYYQRLHTNASELLASTLKGLVIHTADQCGPAPGPNYRTGWGLMNTATAAGLMGQDATNGLRNNIKEVLLPNGQSVQFPVVSPGGTDHPLKVTICWTDPPATANAETNLNNPARKLINDLDLRVIGPGNTTNYPFVLYPDLTNQSASVRSLPATNADNVLDNVEQVSIANPTNGTYLVRVTHKGTLQNSNAQWVSILVSGNTPQQAPQLRLNQFLLTSTNTIAIGWPAVVGQMYQVGFADALLGTNVMVTTNWYGLGGLINARLTNVVVQVGYSPTQSQRFYRVVQAQ